MVWPDIRPAQIERIVHLPIAVGSGTGADEGQIGGLGHRQLGHDARQCGRGGRAGVGVLGEAVGGVGDMPQVLR